MFTEPPKTREQALTLALFLALTASDDERARLATEQAERLAYGLSESKVELCKAKALEMSEAAAT